MSNINTIHAVGNLVDDVTLRFTTTKGEAVANGRVAVNERVQTNGEWKDRVNFVNIVVWGATAENLATSCRKGDRVMFSGRLANRDYESQDGVKQYRTEIVVDEIGPTLRWATVEGVTRMTSGQAVDANVAGEPDPI